MTNKEKYKLFCESAYVPVFSQHWWLDAVCIDGYWDVILYEKEDNIIGALPYYVKKKLGISYITQPEFTPNNGVLIAYPENILYEKKLALEKEVMYELISQLEKLSIIYYQQSFHYSYTNWLPFYWNGYSQRTNYTYVIDNIKDTDNLISRYNDVKRKEIKRAIKLNLSLGEDLDKDIFYNQHKSNLEKRGRKIGYTKDLFLRIVNSAYQNNSGKILFVKDENDNLLCGRFIIWDSQSAYSLISFTNQENKNSGASTLLFHECIKFSSKFVDKFDFEGSMDEQIENSYRKFGTKQMPYFSINKILTSNFLFRALIKNKLGR